MASRGQSPAREAMRSRDTQRHLADARCRPRSLRPARLPPAKVPPKISAQPSVAKEYAPPSTDGPHRLTASLNLLPPSRGRPSPSTRITNLVRGGQGVASRRPPLRATTRQPGGEPHGAAPGYLRGLPLGRRVLGSARRTGTGRQGRDHPARFPGTSDQEKLGCGLLITPLPRCTHSLTATFTSTNPATFAPVDIITGVADVVNPCSVRSASWFAAILAIGINEWTDDLTPPVRTRCGLRDLPAKFGILDAGIARLSRIGVLTPLCKPSPGILLVSFGRSPR